MSDAPEMSTDGTDAIEDSAVIEAVVADLAKLSFIEYEKVRKDKAKELGFRATVLDVLVKAARPRNDTQPASGNVMSFAEPEAWPHPVDGAALVADIEQSIAQYVFLSAPHRLAVALWIIFTHTFEAARISPRLLVTSPTKRCGKTRLMEVVAELACRVEAVSSISPAAVFRAISAWRPTLLHSRTGAPSSWRQTARRT